MTIDRVSFYLGFTAGIVGLTALFTLGYAWANRMAGVMGAQMAGHTATSSCVPGPYEKGYREAINPQNPSAAL